MTSRPHLLPEEPLARERLAFAMNVGSWDELAAKTNLHRQRVERYFTPDRVRSGGAHGRHCLHRVHVRSGSRRGERARMIVSCGSANPDPINARFEELRTSAYYRRLDETGRRRLRDLIARILPMLASDAAPTTTLARILRIFEMIGGRTVYLALLTENAAALRRLVELCAASQFLADQIAAQPLLLDELIDERFVEEAPSRADFAADLASSRGRMQHEDPERQVELLRQFQSAAMFRVAVADLTAGLPLMKVGDRLDRHRRAHRAGNIVAGVGADHREARRASFRRRARRVAHGAYDRRGLRQARRSGAGLRLGSGSGVPA